MTSGLVGAGTRSVVQLLGDLDPDFDPVIAVLEVWGEATDPSLRLEVWAALRPGLALLKSEIESQSRHGLSGFVKTVKTDATLVPWSAAMAGLRLHVSRVDGERTDSMHFGEQSLELAPNVEDLSELFGQCLSLAAATR